MLENVRAATPIRNETCAVQLLKKMNQHLPANQSPENKRAEVQHKKIKPQGTLMTQNIYFILKMATNE